MLWLCQLPINNNDWEYNFNFPVADQTHGISLIWSTRSLYLWHSTHDIVDLTLLTHAEEDRARWSLIDLLIPWNSFKQQLPVRSLREGRISPLKVTLTWLSNPYHSVIGHQSVTVTVGSVEWVISISTTCLLNTPRDSHLIYIAISLLVNSKDFYNTLTTIELSSSSRSLLNH